MSMSVKSLALIEKEKLATGINCIVAHWAIRRARSSKMNAFLCNSHHGRKYRHTTSLGIVYLSLSFLISFLGVERHFTVYL